MADKTGPVKSKLQLSRGKTPGWSAFDQKQRQREDDEPQITSDPYPPIFNGNSINSNIVKNKFPGFKSFSSVLRPALNFQSGPSTSKCGSLKIDSNADSIIAERSAISPVRWLKQIHDWASEDFILDILAATANDGELASAILRTMAPAVSNEKTDKVVSNNMHEDTVKGENDLIMNILSDRMEEKSTVKSLISVPIEPDWQVDDVYLVHRKDAIRMTRLASQHSQAARNAYLRGDHSSARQLSLKAQEEWNAAKSLNDIAAKKILSIHNVNNGMWKLDLHGLHASEAVHALKEHLLRIESEVATKHSISCDEITKLAYGITSSFTEPAGMTARVTSGQCQNILHVITGSGNHSHGGAALPTAISGFLIEHGYRFDHARAGVFAVRPKFRPK